MDTLSDVGLVRKTVGLPIYFGTRRVGKLIPDLRVAYFRVRWERHFFRKLSGWTLDRGIIEDLRGKADAVIFDDAQFGQAWIATVEDFLTHAELTHNTTGLKSCLHRRFWRQVGADEGAMVRSSIAQPEQMEFSGVLKDLAAKGHGRYA